MRVLFVTLKLPTPKSPNTIAPINRQINSLRAIGIQVDVLEVAGIPALKYLFSLPKLWKMARTVDLVHAHYGFCGWLARFQRQKPLVVSFMGSDLLGTRNQKGAIPFSSQVEMALNQVFLPLIDGIIVKSPEMAQKTAPHPAFVVPNGVDVDLFKPLSRSEARDVLGWANEKRIVLFAGDPDEARKDYPLASQAFDILCSLNNEAFEMKVLKNVASDLVPLYMNAANVMWLTSYSEGSPNVVKEAMACNLPVVSVPVGDAAYLLDGVNNSFVVERNPQQIARVTQNLVSSAAVSNGREMLLEKNLDLQSVAYQLRDIYHQVMGGDGTKRGTQK